MPRLSIIIPHQNDDASMESTILSVLENRPADCEIIVVHDGSYSDPYHLGDELLLIEESASKPASQVNAGLMMSRAPVVCILSNGAVILREDWADGPSNQLMGADQLASLAVTTQLLLADTKSMGICREATSDACCLQAGRIDSQYGGYVCGPTLSCGFYRRRILLAIGGWNDQIAWENADVELALLMNRLGLQTESYASECVVATTSKQRLSSSASIKELADLAVAYGLTEAGFPSAVSHLVKGLLGRRFSRSLAWSTGLLRSNGTLQFAERLKVAELGLHRLRQQDEARPVYPLGLQRAA